MQLDILYLSCFLLLYIVKKFKNALQKFLGTFFVHLFYDSFFPFDFLNKQHFFVFAFVSESLFEDYMGRDDDWDCEVII